MKEINMDAIYVDQAAIKTKADCMKFFAAYTPYGIHQIDYELSKKIMAKELPRKKMITEVKQNPHLHKVIKNNLLANIKRIYEKN